MERAKTKTRNDEIRHLYHTTDCTHAVLGRHFNLSPSHSYLICKGTKKAAKLIGFPHREQKQEPVTPGGVEGNYSNRQPHPRINYDYNLLPLNPAFGARYIKVSKEYLEGGAQ